MGRMGAPQRVKRWFTPACFSVFATSSPPVRSAIEPSAWVPSGPQVGVANDVRFAELGRGARADDLAFLEAIAVVGEGQGLPQFYHVIDNIRLRMNQNWLIAFPGNQQERREAE